MTNVSSPPGGSIPPSIEQFLLERVATHEQLQTLLWLLQHSEDPISAGELEPELGIPALELQEALSELADAQLLARAGDSLRYRYAPARSDLDAKTRLLAILYEQDRFEVVRVMAENAMKRMWNAARIAFLEALSDSRLSGRLGAARPASDRRDGKRRSNAPEPAWKISPRREPTKTARDRRSERLHR